MERKKSFYLMALALAVPNIIQQLVTNLSQMVDNLMVGRLAEIAIASVSITNQIFFIFTIVIIGIGATGGIFIAQYKGAKNYQKVQEVFRVTVILSSIVGILFFCAMHFFPETFLRFFVKDTATIISALEYVQYIKYTFLIYPISIAIGTSYRFFGLTQIPMYVAIASVLVNIFFNYGLIYGNMGFPALGVAGSAIATLIARIVELVIFLVLTRKLKTPIYTKLVKLFKFEKHILKEFLDKGIGLVSNEFFWSLGLQLATIIYTQRISENIAAYSIANVMIQLIFVGMGGMSVAISIILGNNLGQGNFNQARRDSLKLIKLCTVVGLCLGVLVLISSYFITMLYNVNPETLKTARFLILAATSCSWLYYLNASHFFTLRAGGDTKSVLIMDSGFMWCVVLPVAYLTGHLHLYLPLHYFLVQCVDLLKFILARYRYKKERWLTNLTIDESLNN